MYELINCYAKIWWFDRETNELCFCRRKDYDEKSPRNTKYTYMAISNVDIIGLYKFMNKLYVFTSNEIYLVVYVNKSGRIKITVEKIFTCFEKIKRISKERKFYFEFETFEKTTYKFDENGIQKIEVL